MQRIGRRRFLELAGWAALASVGGQWPGEAARAAEAPLSPLSGGSLPGASAPTLPLPLPGDNGNMAIMDGATRIVLAATETRRRPAGQEPPPPVMAFEAINAGRMVWNPTLLVPRGASLRVRLRNDLTSPTLLYWHGLTADWRMAGHPALMLAPGAESECRVTVHNRAGVYPYHSLAPGFSGRQSALGMAGLCIVGDEEELAALAALDIEPLGASGARTYRPTGPDAVPTDIPLMFQDQRTGRDGASVYAPTLDDRISGFIGTEVRVNGATHARLDMTTRRYRLRLVNMCNARVLHIGLSASGGDPRPFTLMGTDGGMLERPLPVQRLFLGPGERADILVDLQAAKTGDEMALVNLPFDPMRRAGGVSGSAGTPGEGEAARLLLLRVVQRVEYDRPMPVRLCEAPPMPPMPQPPPRRLVLSRGEDTGRPAWLLNGQPFALRHDTDAEPPADFPALRVAARGTEIWELVNDATSIPHALRLSGYMLRVLERSGSPTQVASLAVDTTGRSATDTGIKDTVLVWPGETVRVLVDFRDSPVGPQRAALYSRVLECLDDGMVQDVAIP